MIMIIYGIMYSVDNNLTLHHRMHSADTELSVYFLVAVKDITQARIRIGQVCTAE